MTIISTCYPLNQYKVFKWQHFEVKFKLIFRYLYINLFNHRYSFSFHHISPHLMVISWFLVPTIRFSLGGEFGSVVFADFQKIEFPIILIFWIKVNGNPKLQGLVNTASVVWLLNQPVQSSAGSEKRHEDWHCLDG